jgi:hypothetical protein
MPAALGGHPGWPNWEDAAVPPERLGDYLADQLELLRRHGYDGVFYGHWGQGCVHCRIDFELRTADGIARFRRFMEEAADLVVSYGGSLSGEHGDGHGRAELLPRMFGARLVEAFREFKGIWDPRNRMNPGKLVDPYPLDAHLREGTGYRPAQVATRFAFPWTAAASPVPRGAASAWASAATCRAARCAPASWSPARRSTPRGGGPGCCRRCWRPRRPPATAGATLT